MKKRITPAKGPAHAVPGISALIFSLVTMFAFTDSYGQYAELLYDIVESEEFSNNEYSQFTPGNGRVFFVSGGRELWTSDAENPDALEYLKTFESISDLTLVGRNLFFAADDGSTGTELWKSDGTPEGTVRVKDIRAGFESSAPTSLTPVRGTLYFSASDGTHGRELWKSNGSPNGTVLVKDIMPRGGNSTPRSLTDVNGTLFFAASDGAHGVELWKCNGTTGGTVMVKDIRPGDRVNSTPSDLVNVYGTLFFVAADPGAGRELWKSDGTPQGTVLVKDILPGSGESRIKNSTAMYRTLYFSATDGVHGQELWKSDGTEAGTRMVKDLTPGPKGSTGTQTFSFEMGNFTSIYGTLFFTAYGGDTYFIWKSNGTESGTVPIMEARGPGILQPRPAFTFMNNRIYFFNRNEEDTETITFYSMDHDGREWGPIFHFFYPDQYNPYYPGMALVGDRFYLSGKTDPWSGFKIYASDGTTEGTVILEDVNTATEGSYPQEFSRFNGRIFFRANHSWYQQHELWVTDGTPGGTHLFFEWGEEINRLEIIGNDLFASALQSFGLYKTDLLTGEGMQLIPSEYGKLPISFFEPSNGILFLANEQGEIWRSDGTLPGTFPLGDFHRIISLHAVAGGVMFRVIHEDNTEELWKSNGTEAGTLRVKTIRAGADSFYPGTWAVSGNTYYFVANDGTHGNELWKSDGTDAGTHMVADLNTVDARVDDIHLLTVFNGELFISAVGHDGQSALYRSDGTASGTEFIRLIPPVGAAVQMGDNLYLFTREYRGGSEWTSLWVTDGTEAGTSLIKDLNMLFGKFSHEIVDDVLFFSTMEQGTLARTDGTECGTLTIDVGTFGGGASPLMALGHTLVFGSYDLHAGVEPHALDLSDGHGDPCSEEALMALTATANEERSLAGYPNPFTNDFAFRIPGTANDPAHVSVFTLYGHPVEDLGEVAANLDHRIGLSWPPGVYIVQVTRSDAHVTRHRVVKK